MTDITTHAMRVVEAGGPQALRWQEITLPDLQPAEARIKHHAVGLNFIDTHHRSGHYRLSLPTGIGNEAAGVVEAVGSEVTQATGIVPGDRVVYAGGALGAYAELRNVPARLLVRLPDAIDFNTAAAMMWQGLTAQYLLRSTYRVTAGETIVIHAAAGGVGTIACQWAKCLGATVIGIVSSEAKAQMALAQGCAHALVYGHEGVASRVRELTGGVGVPVVYDSVGRDTFMDSLNCLRPRGLLVCFGIASGPVEQVDISILMAKGSLYLTRPGLDHYIGTRAALLASAAELFEMVTSGKIVIKISKSYALKDAALAHIDIAARATTGSSILLP